MKLPNHAPSRVNFRAALPQRTHLQENCMSIRQQSARAALASALAVAMLASSGCHWFHRGNADYQKSVENRPLEIPPDLDKPTVDQSMQIPSGTSGMQRGVSSAPPAASSIAPGGDASFIVTDTPAGAWTRLGNSLGHVDGVTITQRAQLLNSYEVQYKGATFLLRVNAEGAASRVNAVGADGQGLHSAEANELLGLLHDRIG
jgi:uncharacterized lipoprotein